MSGIKIDNATLVLFTSNNLPIPLGRSAIDFGTIGSLTVSLRMLLF